jgi:acyl carrier protein
MSDKQEVKNMSMDELKKTIKTIVEANLGGKSISDSDHFDTDLKLDSITKMELLMEFEDSFGIEISDSDAAQLTSVDATAEYVKKSV